MCITTAEQLKKNLNGYLSAAENDDKIYITTKTGNVVLVNEEYLRGLEESVYLYGVPGMREKIMEGVNQPLETCEDWDGEF